MISAWWARPRSQARCASSDEDQIGAGMHRVSIVELENGKRPARPRALKKLADALEVSTRDLAENGR